MTEIAETSQTSFTWTVDIPEGMRSYVAIEGS